MLNFLGIGAQKAGTTWLFEHLRHDPEIVFPGGKEMHFWNHYQPPARADQGAHGHPFGADLQAYLALFLGEDRIKGEITPAYALLEPAVIAAIAQVNPALRILYLIRDPIERAWSAALMALERAELNFHEASDQWFIDHFRSSGSLRRGDYQHCLERWRAVFPADQILVELHDSLRDQPQALLCRCARHLGGSARYFEQADPNALRQPVFAGQRHPIRPSLLPVLEDIYRPRIARLARYLGTDLPW